MIGLPSSIALQASDSHYDLQRGEAASQNVTQHCHSLTFQIGTATCAAFQF